MRMPLTHTSRDNEPQMNATRLKLPANLPLEAALPAPGWHATLKLAYAQVNDRTVLIQREHQGPLRVQKALYPEGEAVCHTILLHPPGGIAGGDVLHIDARLNCGSHVQLVSPGATKWYRSGGRPAGQHVSLRLSANSALEWLPHETILFDGAEAHIGMQIDLEPGAVYMGWDILCFGRTACGETFTHGHLRQAVRINLAGKALWRELADIHGGSLLMQSPAGLAGYPVSGTLLLAGMDVPAELLEACRMLAVDHNDRSGLTCLPKLLVARYLGHQSETAKAWFIALWRLLRPHAMGRQAVLPRIWQT